MASAEVQSTPVVVIAIEGDLITVNGDSVEHDGTRNPYEVAIHTAAERVAQVLRRPVRAVARDSSGTTSLVIHEDGSVSELEFAPSAVASAGERPDPVISSPETTLETSEGSVAEEGTAELPGSEASSLDLMLAAEPAPTVREPRRPLVLVAGVAAAALLGLGGSYAAYATWDSDSTVSSAAASSSPLPAEAPPAATPSSSPTASPTPAPRITLRASAKSGVRVVTVVVSLSSPAKVNVSLGQRSGRWKASRALEAGPKTRSLVFRNVPAGTVSWKVSSGSATRSGLIQVKAPTRPQRPQATSAARPTSPPRPAATYTPPPVYTPQPTKAPEPPSRPAPKPKGPTAPGHTKGPSGPVR